MLNAIKLSCERNQQLLFSDLSFSVKPGEILHVLGSNGSGKSSLLQILSGLLQPQTGTIYWCEQAINQLGYYYKSNLLYLGHKLGVRLGLTVVENIQLYMKLNALTANTDWQNACQRLGLWQFKDQLCGRLSVGQRQRLALIRLLINPAPVWLLDEPFTAVDKEGIEQLHVILTEHMQNGGLAIITSHQALAINYPKINQLQLRN